MKPQEAIPERRKTQFGVESAVAMGTRRALAGFGRALRSSAVFSEPTSVLALRDVLTDATELGLSVTCRGSGRSYGDAALNAYGLVLSLSKMRRILAWDPATGIIDVEPGVTIEMHGAAEQPTIRVINDFRSNMAKPENSQSCSLPASVRKARQVPEHVHLM